MTAARKRYVKFYRDMRNRLADHNNTKRHDVRYDSHIQWGAKYKFESGEVVTVNSYDEAIRVLKDIFSSVYQGIYKEDK